MTDQIPYAGVRRGWLALATAGCLLVVLALTVVCLVMVDKKHFGWLVGSLFLAIVTSSVVIGAIMLLVGTWNLPIRRNWQGVVLFAWALVALTSPLFGFLFLLPWGVLVLTLPVVGWILVELFRLR